MQHSKWKNRLSLFFRTIMLFPLILVCLAFFGIMALWAYLIPPPLGQSRNVGLEENLVESEPNIL